MLETGSLKCLDEGHLVGSRPVSQFSQVTPTSSQAQFLPHLFYETSASAWGLVKDAARAPTQAN